MLRTLLYTCIIYLKPSHLTGFQGCNGPVVGRCLNCYRNEVAQSSVLTIKRHVTNGEGIEEGVQQEMALSALGLIKN